MEPDIKLADAIISIETLKAIYYWLNYQKTISSSNLLCESYMKIPIVECLERKMKAQVETEINHPCFSTRLIDLSYHNAIGDRRGFIELKYVRKNTAYSSERKRIMNDLFRLYLAGKDKKFTTNYFIIAGEAEVFDTCFKETEFADFFPWDYDEASKCKDYKDYLNTFCKKYKYNEEPSLLKDMKIEFVGVYPAEGNQDNASMKVCAWEIV